MKRKNLKRKRNLQKKWKKMIGIICPEFRKILEEKKEKYKI